jgi:hypothetical protein
MVVTFYHHHPRGIVTDTADELEDGGGIADGSYYLIVDHTLSELRVATSVGHHSQKYSSLGFFIALDTYATQCLHFVDLVADRPVLAAVALVCYLWFCTVRAESLRPFLVFRLFEPARRAAFLDERAFGIIDELVLYAAYFLDDGYLFRMAGHRLFLLD